jgi:hypothetical protein
VQWSSPNAPCKRDVLGTVVLSILCGHQRYAHIREDKLCPGAAGETDLLANSARYVLWEPEAGDCLRRPGGGNLREKIGEKSPSVRPIELYDTVKLLTGLLLSRIYLRNDRRVRHSVTIACHHFYECQDPCPRLLLL